MSIADRWIIYHDSEQINTIVASEEYVKHYCQNNNYTYKKDNTIDVTEPNPVVILQQENKLLKAQVQAASDRSDFLEDCIAEMATIVYNTEETK